MAKISKLKFGMFIVILIIVVAVVLTMAYYLNSDLEGEDTHQDNQDSDVVNEMDNFNLQGLVIVDNEIPNLTIAVISENIGEVNLLINGSWNLTKTNNSEILDSGADNFLILADSNQTRIIQPITEYVGSVVFEYKVNGKSAFEIFNTTTIFNATEDENETEEPPEDNETSNGDDDNSGGGGGSSGGGGGSTPPPVGSYYGFSEYDPNGTLTLTENRITFDEIHRDNDGSIYKDFGVGYFGQTFTHKFQFIITSGNDSLEGTFMPWSVCNNISTYHQFRYGPDCFENTSDDHKGLALTIHPKGEEDKTPSNMSENITEPHGNIRDWTLGTAGHFVIPDEDFFGKMIYVTVTRSNGFIVVVLYRDYSRTDVITSASTATGPESYSIIQAFGARGSRPCAPWYSPMFFVSGYLEELDLG